jgi:hypothetical protein
MATVLGLLQQAINPNAQLFKVLAQWQKLDPYLREPTRKKRTSQAASRRRCIFG